MAKERLDVDRVLAGARKQWERAGKFAQTINIAGASEAIRRVAQLLWPRLGELRLAAGLPEAPPTFARARSRRATKRLPVRPVPADRVFTYWNEPIQDAPPLVQVCVEQLRRTHPQLQVLDGVGVREWVTIPDRVADLLETDRPAHFSDYVRTRLLAEHGGIWFDATTWAQHNLDSFLAPYLTSGTVFPRWTKVGIGNWFIASQPESPLIKLQFLALGAWWDAYDDLPDYFLYHRIFEVIQALVPEAKGQWDATPTLSAGHAHRLQLSMMQPYDAAAAKGMLTEAPLQKLSYKYDDVPAGSVLERLLSGRQLG